MIYIDAIAHIAINGYCTYSDYCPARATVLFKIAYEYIPVCDNCQTILEKVFDK